jgi:hypothetical protein
MSSAAFVLQSTQDPVAGSSRRPLERALLAPAGTMTLLSAALAALVSPWFLLLTAFVAVSPWLYLSVGARPASLVLRRLFPLQPVLYPRQEVRP